MRLVLFCTMFINASIHLLLTQRRESSVHGSYLRSAFKQFSLLFKDIGQDHASISVYRIFNAFCMAVQESDACSPIRSVLSWTNLLPFPLLERKTRFTTSAELSSRLWQRPVPEELLTRYELHDSDLLPEL